MKNSKENTHFHIRAKRVKPVLHLTTHFIQKPPENGHENEGNDHQRLCRLLNKLSNLYYEKHMEGIKEKVEVDIRA